MKLYSIPSGYFKLDGGAMFGVVPKSLWQRVNPPDEKNLCTWAMRLLLVEEGERLVLIDTGVGDKQSERFFSHYEPHGDDSIDKSLARHGFTREDITDVFLTHLHFDHVGGAIVRQGDQLVPAFPNARYWSHEDHWHWALHPNAREKASFLKENIEPIAESGQLHLIREGDVPELFPGFDIRLSYGHTEAQMIPHIRYKGHTVVFCADSLPSAGHIPLPWVMAYDIRPLVTMDEKKEFLTEAAREGYVLFLEHDKDHECCTVKMTEKGPRLDRTFPLESL